MTTKTSDRSTGIPNVIGPAPENPLEGIQQVYQELRRMAGQLFQRERPDHTLQPTALVHEVFIRLSEHGPKSYANSAHFFSVISRAMRQILVEHARRRLSKKRGGAWHKASLEDADLVAAQDPDFVTLDALLTRLNAFDPRLSQIAELRLFGGLSTRETAAVLRRGESTIRRDWHTAKAWLRRELEAAQS